MARIGRSGYPDRVTSNMSSRALPIAVVGFSLVFFWALAWFAFAGGGTLTDPADILTQGAQATANGDSFHLSVSASGGSGAESGMGMGMSLDGVTVDGDVDVANKSAHVAFELPGMFGLSGEAIVIGPDTYVLTSLTGDKWVHMTSDQTDGDQSGHEPPTADEIATKVDEFLATEGVTAEKLDDAPCGNDTCYHVQVTVSSETLLQHYLDNMGSGGDMGILGQLGMGQMDPADLLRGPLVVDLLFQQNGLWLRGVSVGAEAGGLQGTSLTVVFSNWNQSVNISAPPADQVTEEGDLPIPVPYN